MSKHWLSWLLLAALAALYLSNLGSVGFLGPDEPRYASIGREMARSGDWITPRLDGQPWFEKSPLLYWMTAAGTLIGLPGEWAARLPLALVSLAFLLFFHRTLEREFSPGLALVATAILATSAGWIAYSFAAVTDLPMSAALGAAMLIAVFGPSAIERRDPRSRVHGYAAGAMLGLAVLAKGLVPLVLALPMFLVARGKRIHMLAATVAVAAPWYLLCGLRNGAVFWQEFLWKHHVQRYFQSGLEHAQPFWYYVPVLLLGLFPWTPLAALLFRRKTYDDERVRFLALLVLFGFVFFSGARNKLPGYLLPLLPALAVVLAVAVRRSPGAAWWLAGSTSLLAAVPVIAGILPEALVTGITHTDPRFAVGWPFLVAAAVVAWLAWSDYREEAVAAAALAAVLAVGYLKIASFGDLDRRVSVRGFFEQNQAALVTACVGDEVARDLVYGLNYYHERPLPACSGGAEARISTAGDELKLLQGSSQ